MTPLLVGCATPVVLPGDAESECRQYFTEIDRAIRSASVQDEGSYPIPGFPYLRTDRFLASFADEVEDESRFTAWTERLAQLDRKARAYELANLPEKERLRHQTYSN